MFKYHRGAMRYYELEIQPGHPIYDVKGRGKNFTDSCLITQLSILYVITGRLFNFYWQATDMSVHMIRLKLVKVFEVNADDQENITRKNVT